MPTRLTTAHEPFTADTTPASSRTSANTDSTLGSDMRSGWRAAMRTCAPHAPSRGTKRRPMNPDPPKTVTVVSAIALGPRASRRQQLPGSERPSETQFVAIWIDYVKETLSPRGIAWGTLRLEA